MGSADVTQALGKSGDGQAKRESHLDLLIWFVIVGVSNCSCNAEEDEEGHTHQLGQNGPPERLALQLLHDWHLWAHGCVSVGVSEGTE